MLAYNLKGKQIKFVAFGVDDGERTRRFYDEDSKDAYTEQLDQEAIKYTVTEYDEPTQELLDSVENIKFNTIQEARDFLDGKLDEITEIQLALVELYELLLGGAE